MEGQNCVLPVLLAVLIVHACGWMRATDARDDAEIMARLAALENGQRESQAEIRALREVVANQKDAINEQSKKLRTLEQDIITLKASQYRQFKRFERRERLHQSQRDRLNAETQESAAYKDQEPSSLNANDNVKENSNTIRGIQAAVGTNIHQNLPKRQVPEVVAFTFYLDHNEDLAAHQVMKFNKEITNEGNGYNMLTGIFTCPTSGMYLIYFSIGERNTNQQYAALMVNSQNIVHAVVEGFHDMQDLQGSNTAMVRLNQGDSVWVESMRTNGFHVEGSAGLRLTTFSGVLLYP